MAKTEAKKGDIGVSPPFSAGFCSLEQMVLGGGSHGVKMLLGKGEGGGYNCHVSSWWGLGPKRG